MKVSTNTILLEIIGKRVTVLVNLAPRNLRGIESQGMILMTNLPDGKLVFLNPDTSTALCTGSDGVGNGGLFLNYKIDF